METLIYLLTVRENQRKMKKQTLMKRNNNISTISSLNPEIKSKHNNQLQSSKKIQRIKRFATNSISRIRLIHNTSPR